MQVDWKWTDWSISSSVLQVDWLVGQLYRITAQASSGPLGIQEIGASRISNQSAYEGGKVVSPTHRPPLPARRYIWYLYVLQAESTPGP